MRRIINVFLSLTILLSVICADTYAINNEINYAEAVNMMNALGVMQISDSPEEIDKVVTRGEFAGYIANLIGIESVDEPNVYFIDVPKSDPYCGVLAALYEMNIIKGSTGGSFEPGRGILYEEAYKMVVEACGYGVVAEADGGYPMGYMKTAAKFDILADGVQPGTLTAGACAEILYIASTAKLHDRSYGSGELEFYPGEDTLLSRYKGVYTYQGVLNGAFGVSLVDESETEIGELILGDTRFSTDGSAKDFEDAEYLGIEMRGLYTKDNDGKKTLFYLSEYSDNDTMQIDADSFISYNGYTISYYSGNENKKNIGIEKGAVYIYNGARVDENIESLYQNFDRGSITLRKTTGKGGYDLVIIKSYENFVVGSYGASANILTEKDNAINSIKFDEYEYTKIYENGLQIDKIVYNPKDVLTIAKCGKAIEINKNTGEVIGTIGTMSTSGEYVQVSIGENMYQIDKDCSLKQGSKIQPGTYCKAKTDMFGRIAYIDFDVSSDWIFAYALRVAYRDGVFGDGQNLIELYNINKEFKELVFAEKLVFDGEDIDGNEKLLERFPEVGEDGQISMQMVRYKTNSAGEINEFDTCGAEENSIKASDDGRLSKKIYAPAMGMFYDGANQQIAINDKTMVMEVPYIGTEYDDIKDNREIYFDVYEIGKISAFNQSMVGGYVIGDEDISPIIIRTEETEELQDRANDAVIVEGIGSAADENGDEYQTLCGYKFDGTKVEFMIDSDVVLSYINGINELSESDVVGVRTYNRGANTFVRMIQKVFDNTDPAYENLGTELGWNCVSKDRMAWHHARADYSNFIYGNVVKIKDNMLHLSTHEGGKAVQMYDASKAPIVVYDAGAARQRFYIGSIADVMDAETFGNGGSRVIIRKNEIVPVGILVYK